jgi:hypothetical protein
MMKGVFLCSQYYPFFSAIGITVIIISSDCLKGFDAFESHL